jgi:hypothetical protein
MVVTRLLGHFSTSQLSNSITNSFRSVLYLGNWNMSTCLSGNLVTNLSRDLSLNLILDDMALLLRLVLYDLSVLCFTFLFIFSVARLPGHLLALLSRNLLTFLSWHILALLLWHLLALLSCSLWLVLALLSGLIPTLLSGLIPALLMAVDIAALPLSHC